MSLPLSPLLAELRPLFAQIETPVFLVGGAVRDALLGKTSHDLDFVVPNEAIKLSFKVGNALGAPAYVLDKERDTGRVMWRGTSLDFARFRGDDLTADLRDRDFTLNALALPATATEASQIIDVCNGLAHLQAKELHLTHPNALKQDPARVLRAVRQSLGLGLTMSAEVETAVRQAAPFLPRISKERVRDELLKIVAGQQADEALRLLEVLGVLPIVLPDIAELAEVEQSAPHHEHVLPHTRSVLRWLAEVETAVLTKQETSLPHLRQQLAPYQEGLQNHLNRHIDGDLNGHVLLRLGALFHDVGKKETQTVEADGRIRFLGHDQVGAKLTKRCLRQLALSNEARGHVGAIVAGHMHPLALLQQIRLSRRSIYRFFRKHQTAGLDILLLSLADHLATYQGPHAEWTQLMAHTDTLLRHYFEHHTETIAPPRLLDGRDLMRIFQVKGGAHIGRWLRALEEAQAVGEIIELDEAIAFVQALKAEEEQANKKSAE